MNNVFIIEDGEFLEGKQLIKADSLPYAMLNVVLSGKIKKIVTDKKRFIIAHTADIFPTWIWMPDDYTEDEFEKVFSLIKREFTPVNNYRFNTKTEIAHKLVEKFKTDMKLDYKITVNIVSYECRNPLAPCKEVEGSLRQLCMEDFELAKKLIHEASTAIGDRQISEDELPVLAKERLERGVLFVWEDLDKNVVSFCDKNPGDRYVKISQVYTPEKYRGNSYAARLIYELCDECVKNGEVPMLYADADYESSNRCYQKIGFVNKGRIATIANYRDNNTGAIG